MTAIEVRIVQLESMRMISAYGYSDTPENDAWLKLITWAKPKGLIKDSEPFTTYGFNNPNPSPGSPNYGYEIWLPAADEIKPEEDMRVIHFSGGLYAVTRFKGLENIGTVWKQLVEWRETSKYKRANHQWLEEQLTMADDPEDFEFDIYLPIAE